MHLHVLGICGTFMAGLAYLARELGHTVSGSDLNIYPPMSDFLAAAEIEVRLGWEVSHLTPRPDLVIVGNALSRGNPLVEEMLDRRIPYTSGPAWLAEHVLRGRHVLAVAGTHGKTTTTSLLAWILEVGGRAPGFLIGGIPENFAQPARLGDGRYFVIEADEYDTAFFDKRAKFVHYGPATVILNNLEFDHADIFKDLAAIQTQFHHLIRTVPRTGVVVWNCDDRQLDAMLTQGLWSRQVTFGEAAEADWKLTRSANGEPPPYAVTAPNSAAVSLHSPLPGRHNALNVLAALTAAAQLGVPVTDSLEALKTFKNVKRRLQILGTVAGVTLYDDFAHHPTAIAATLAALRETVGTARIVAVLESRSNTMRMGVHQHALAPALAAADVVLLYAPPDLGWNVGVVTAALEGKATAYPALEDLLKAAAHAAIPGAHVLVMSNGDFGGFQRQLLAKLAP